MTTINNTFNDGISWSVADVFAHEVLANPERGEHQRRSLGNKEKAYA
jgi:hypothetical protein